MYSRNQYYQPYQARDKQKDSQTGQTDRIQEAGLTKQQIPLSLPSSPSTPTIPDDTAGNCKLSSILKVGVFLIILLSTSGVLVFWFLKHHNSAQEIMKDTTNNIASRFVIDSDVGKEKSEGNEHKKSTEMNHKEIKVFEKLVIDEPVIATSPFPKVVIDTLIDNTEGHTNTCNGDLGCGNLVTESNTAKEILTTYVSENTSSTTEVFDMVKANTREINGSDFDIGYKMDYKIKENQSVNDISVENKLNIDHVNSEAENAESNQTPEDSDIINTSESSMYTDESVTKHTTEQVTTTEHSDINYETPYKKVVIETVSDISISDMSSTSFTSDIQPDLENVTEINLNNLNTSYFDNRETNANNDSKLIKPVKPSVLQNIKIVFSDNKDELDEQEDEGFNHQQINQQTADSDSVQGHKLENQRKWEYLEDKFQDGFIATTTESSQEFIVKSFSTIEKSKDKLEKDQVSVLYNDQLYSLIITL